MILDSTIDKAVNVLEIGPYVAQEVYYSRLGTLSFAGYAVWDSIHRQYVEMDVPQGNSFNNKQTIFESKDDVLELLRELADQEHSTYTEEDFEI